MARNAELVRGHSSRLPGDFPPCCYSKRNRNAGGESTPRRCLSSKDYHKTRTALHFGLAIVISRETPANSGSLQRLRLQIAQGVQHESVCEPSALRPLSPSGAFLWGRRTGRPLW